MPGLAPQQKMPLGVCRRWSRRIELAETAWQGRLAPQLGRAFASGKLRAEVPEAVRRRRVLPVYKAISDFEATLGLEASRAPRIITLAPDGAIVGVACLSEHC